MLIVTGGKIIISNCAPRDKKRRSKKRKRDYQRTRVYKAESLAAKDNPCYLAVRPEELIDGAIALDVYRIVSDKRFVHKLGRVSFDVEVIRRSGQSRTYKDRRVVFMADEAICRYDLAHEAAHIATSGGIPHGPEFCSAMLLCTEIALGKTCSDQLRMYYDALGVDY